MSEEIIEELGLLDQIVRAISQTEGSLVALVVYWAIVGLLGLRGVLDGVQVSNLFTSGTVVMTLIRALNTK